MNDRSPNQTLLTLFTLLTLLTLLGRSSSIPSFSRGPRTEDRGPSLNPVDHASKADTRSYDRTTILPLA